MFTASFERYVRPARATAQIWRLVVGVLVIAGVYFAGIAAVFGVIWLTAGRLGVRMWAEKLADASTPTGTMLLLASFVGMALAPMVAVKLVHRRSVASLFGPKKRVIRDFTISAGTIFVLYSIMTAIWSLYFDAEPNLSLGLWLSFLPIALVGVLVQTCAEELVFRGYLQQQLAARFRSPIAWMILPSIAFGLVHYDPGSAGANTWLLVASATVFGLVAADLTRITGSIGAAWGFHFANNVLAVLFIAVKGTIPGLALYLTPYTADDTNHIPALISADFAALIVGWLILRRILRR